MYVIAHGLETNDPLTKFVDSDDCPVLVPYVPGDWNHLVVLSTPPVDLVCHLTNVRTLNRVSVPIPADANHSSAWDGARTFYAPAMEPRRPSWWTRLRRTFSRS